MDKKMYKVWKRKYIDIELSSRLPNHITIIQAEVYAILKCTEKNKT